MSASLKEISSWKEIGRNIKATHIIITYDTFILEYNPRYVFESKIQKELKNIEDLARITEVIEIINL